MAFQRPHAPAADATFSAAGASAWDANQTPTGADVGGIPYCPTATTETTSSKFTFDGTTLTLAMGTVTAAPGAISITQERNTVGTTYDAVIKAVINDTASAAGSLAMQILGGASGTTELFSVGKSGDTTIGSNGGNSNIKGLGTYTWLWVNGNRAAGVVDTGSIRTFLVGTAADLGLYNAGSGVLRVMDGGSATNYRDLQARIYKNPGIAFASLPTAAAGDIAYITDSSTATWGATIAGGGANPVLGWYNGTNWTVVGA